MLGPRLCEEILAKLKDQSKEWLGTKVHEDVGRTGGKILP